MNEMKVTTLPDRAAAHQGAHGGLPGGSDFWAEVDSAPGLTGGRGPSRWQELCVHRSRGWHQGHGHWAREQQRGGQGQTLCFIPRAVGSRRGLQPHPQQQSLGLLVFKIRKLRPKEGEVAPVAPSSSGQRSQQASGCFHSAAARPVWGQAWAWEPASVSAPPGFENPAEADPCPHPQFPFAKIGVLCPRCPGSLQGAGEQAVYGCPHQGPPPRPAPLPSTGSASLLPTDTSIHAASLVSRTHWVRVSDPRPGPWVPAPAPFPSTTGERGRTPGAGPVTGG